MNMFVSLIALLLAAVGFFAYDQYSSEQALVQTLSAQAQIIGDNSISALLFDDPQSATKTLSALKNASNIASAGLLTPDGHIFAHYMRESEQEGFQVPLLGIGETEAHWFGHSHLLLARAIVSDGKEIGIVYVRANRSAFQSRVERYLLTALAVLALSFLVAMLLSSRLRKSIARPLIELAKTAQEVADQHPYSIRASTTNDYQELANLVDAFNKMLDQIQLRDTDLQRANESLKAARDRLEERVSERTRELVASNRELEAFSYSVSHDLRGPIDSINGFIYLLDKMYGGSMDDNGKELIAQIRSCGTRMTQLIEDFVNLARVSTSAIHTEKVNLSSIAEQIAEQLRATDPHRQVEFDILPTPVANADPHLIRIVLENLLRNSWKYTSKCPTAHIQFGTIGSIEQPTYYLRDDGAGFDPGQTDRLFKPFQRLHAAGEFPGNGIGLATVQRIVFRHRGEIWAEGAVGKGATFYFTLNRRDFQ